MKTESTLRPHERDNDLHLTLGLYQLRVLETALPSARSLSYQIPALLSEIGELQGVLAKEVRDDNRKPNYPARKAELGDVAYLTALMLNDLGVRRITPANTRLAQERMKDDALDVVQTPFVGAFVFSQVGADTLKVLNATREESTPALRNYANHLARLWECLPYLAERLLVESEEYYSRRAAVFSLKTKEKMAQERAALREDIFQDVLNANVLKLADRKKRGKIKGSGDNR